MFNSVGSGHLSAGRLPIEKDRKIVAGILHAAANFWNRIGRKSVENGLDTLTIDLSMNAREMAEANRHHAANPGRRVLGESHALRLHPSPIRVMERGRNKRATYVGFVVRSKPNRECVTIKRFWLFVLHGARLSLN
jgi:hypothetical protein